MNTHVFRIVLYKTLADLRTENSRYFLSFLWWVLEPIMHFAVFYFLFASGFKGGGKGAVYAVFLIIGIMAFRWVSSTVNSGSKSVKANQGLSGQMYLPKWVFPLNVFLVNTVKFMMILSIAIIFANINGYPISSAYVYLPIIVVIEGLFVIGLAMPLAAIIPFVPDLEFVISNVLTLGYFASGVMFDISELPEDVQAILYWNPAAVFVQAFRDVLMDGMAPNWYHLTRAAVISVVLLAVGLYLLIRFDKTYPKVSN